MKCTESGEVKLDAQASGEGVEIRVEDTGVGIPEIRSQLFSSLFDSLKMCPHDA